MNKAALVEKIQELLGGTKVQAEQVVDCVFDNITGCLKKGDEVAIAGFGKFSVKMSKAREARNPKTGATVKVPASKKPKFSAAKALKDTVK
ncbi:MAG: HU family DNA-binding protein [Cyanobium sp. MAG06]|nr:HU family DNA-binding protein [Cyanobium sp. MAG06]